MITLYDIPLSPYAQKVKLALLEKGLEFRSIIPDLDSPTPEFRAASPLLEVPVLVDGDQSLFDSSVILAYLEDRWPEQALLPKSAAARAKVRTLERLCDSQYDAVNWGCAEILFFKRAEGPLAQQLLERAAQQTAGLNHRLGEMLGHEPYFNGQQFGYGDIVVLPYVQAAAGLNREPTPGSLLSGWFERVRSRPSAERVREDIRASLPEFAARPQAVAEGKHRRQYRDHRLDWMLRSGGLQIVLSGMERNDLRFSIDVD